MTWLEGWSYRKSVTLSRPSGAITDYQMKLVVGESVGSAGASVNCHGYCASDFDDIRFTNVSGTLLNYWLESTTGTTPNQSATFWIKFDSIDTAATTFYMYYGNASAPAVTTGSGTFLFFDDFNGVSVDAGLWTDAGGCTVSGGELIVSADAAADHGVRGNTIFTNNYAIRVRAKAAHVNNTSYLEQVKWTNAAQTKQVGIAFCHSGATYNYKYYNYSDPNGANAALTGVSAGTYYVYDLMRNGTTDSRFLTDGGNAATITGYVEGSTDMYPYIGAYYNGSITTVDWILIRKYNVTEPAWGVWGEQEWVDGTPWLTGWSYRKRFVLNAGAAATSYQVKILVGESTTSAGAQVSCNGLCDSNFDDIRFTTFDGETFLPYWIESVTGVSPSQLATIWIKCDYIGLTASSFYLYYGNSSAVAVSNAGATLEFFDHFLVNPPAAADWYHWLTNGSSTVSGSVLSVTGGSSAYEAYGCKQQFGTAYAFRGRVYANVETGTDTGVFGVDDRSATGSYAGSGIDSAMARVSVGSKKWSMRREGTSTDNTRTAALTSWSVVEMRRTATSVQCLVNDVSEGTFTVNVPTDNCGLVIYSYENTSTVYWDWVSVRKYQSPEPTLLGFQDQEPSNTGWIAGWSKRLPLTIGGSNVTETIIDFPIMVYLDFNCSGIFEELGDNSKKISLRLSDYTECYVEVESWDSNTQKAVLWAKIPSLLAYNNVNMYLYYDNTHDDNTAYVGLTTETAAKNVWESSYKCVLHFAQTPAGAGSVKDSTLNANNGLPGATATLVDAQFGKAYDFDGSTTGYVRVTDHASLDFTTAMTMIAFYNLDFIAEGLIATKNTTGSTYAYGLFVQDATKAAAYAGKTGAWAPTFLIYDAVAPTFGTWTMLAGVYNGTNLKCYNNGVYKSVSGDSAGSLYNSAGDLWIGYNSEFSKQFNGKIAFVSFAAAVRTEAYLLLTYKSLKNQLIIIGAEEVYKPYYFSGTVAAKGSPVERLILAYRRDTGELVGTTTSVSGTGAFDLLTTYSGEHYVICLDDSEGDVYNALVYDYIIPATVS